MHIFWTIVAILYVIACIASIIPYIIFVIKCLKQEKYYEIIDADGLTKLIMAFLGIMILYLTLPFLFDFISII